MLIPRQSPTIMGPGNMNMNKFSTANSIVEVASLSDLMATTKASGSTGGGSNAPAPTGEASGAASSGTNTKAVFVMGEFALLPMVKAAAGSNWTIAAVHNHMVLERPKMMFVHWSAQGDINTVTSQIKNTLTTISKVPATAVSR